MAVGERYLGTLMRHIDGLPGTTHSISARVKWDIQTLEFMPDKYPNFSSLRRAETFGAFNIRSRANGLATVIVAPHGGGIEPGTTEIALALAADDLSYYLFEGKKADHNADLHITSSNFDEPSCLALLASANNVLTVHGESSTGEAVFLGGLASVRKASMKAALEAAGFVAEEHDDRILQGLHPQNICNLGAERAGIQLEVSHGLRVSLFESLTRLGRTRPTARLRTFAEAIRGVLRKS
jgi:phage replication-related protein YjqB (UPF0714/DUF867 family)